MLLAVTQIPPKMVFCLLVHLSLYLYGTYKSNNPLFNFPCFFRHYKVIYISIRIERSHPLFAIILWLCQKLNLGPLTSKQSKNYSNSYFQYSKISSFYYPNSIQFCINQLFKLCCFQCLVLFYFGAISGSTQDLVLDMR